MFLEIENKKNVSLKLAMSEAKESRLIVLQERDKDFQAMSVFSYCSAKNLNHYFQGICTAKNIFLLLALI